MATLLIDMDSTIISVESLEVIFEIAKVDKQIIDKISEITRQGMNGSLSFFESLQQRLSYASITQKHLQNFNKIVNTFIDPKLINLIEKFHSEGFEIWVLSGGFQETVQYAGLQLKIDPKKLFGTKMLWDNEGNFLEIRKDWPFNFSKTKGIFDCKLKFKKPVIAIGDGISDFQIFHSGLAQHFIAFTQYQSRSEVCLKAQEFNQTIAQNFDQLQYSIDQILKPHYRQI